MRRWRAILLCLLAGAVMNVLVAWGFAWRFFEGPSATRSVPIRGQHPAEYVWPTPVPADWPADPNLIDSRAIPGYEKRYVARGEVDGTDWCAHHCVSLVRAGWPVRSLEAFALLGPRAGTMDALREGWQFVSGDAGLVFVSNKRERLWLPVRPLWPGFAVNTLLFAGLAWPVVAAPGWLRRRRRRRRGLCPSCAYDLRGTTGVCPECGAQP